MLLSLITRNGGALTRARFAFFAIFLVLFSAADAFSCGAEEDLVAGSSAAIALTNPEAGVHGAPASQPDRHAVCVHGHCHHVVPMAALLPRVSERPRPAVLVPVFAGAPHPSRAPATLERPPRA
jgi:hypothetical protein